MTFTVLLARHTICGAIAAGAAALALSAPALADPPPNCTAGDRAQVAATVSASMSVYLFTHPDINAFFTGLKGQPIDITRKRARVARGRGANKSQPEEAANGIHKSGVAWRLVVKKLIDFRSQSTRRRSLRSRE